jgi:hypothetical protein
MGMDRRSVAAAVVNGATGDQLEFESGKDSGEDDAHLKLGKCHANATPYTATEW